MLNPEETHVLSQNGIDPNTVKSFDAQTGRVVMPDGSEHQLCQVITRVMGYHRPVTDWNKGKQAEHASRTFFTEEKAMTHVEDANLADVAEAVSEATSSL